jgi:intracellular septation protein
MTEAPAKPQINPLLKLVLDIGPLILFFVANSRPALFTPLLGKFLPPEIFGGERVGIFVATAVFMIAILVALAVS